MNRQLARWAAIAVLGLTSVMGLLPAVSTAADEKDLKKHGPIAWQGSLQAALKIAAREKKPIFIDFWAEWCGPCKQMLATTYKDKAVVARAKQFVPVLINADEQPKIAEKFGINGIPTVVFLDAKGKVLLQTTGYESGPEFLKMMDQAAKKFK